MKSELLYFSSEWNEEADARVSVLFYKMENMEYIFQDARVAELVYAHDLKSCLARDVGSIPTSGTGILKKYKRP